MSPDNARARAYQIFSAALDLEPAARGEFTAQQCQGDRELLQWVLRLLAIATADAGATSVLVGGTAAPARDRSGREYGRFRLLERLGAGGMGTVYRAERTDGVPQAVAVKLLRGEISAANSARFFSEARILARLEHPSIARLIDVGIQQGEGWIAMELVRGRPITEYCDARQLDLRARIRLLNAVADAVGTAHRRLVVHRDIKPTNVLVTEDGAAKLIDFGIASALTDPQEAREPTVDIRQLFTPHYAAPEQVRGEPATVATDVFGLGALAYRVLSGVEPFPQATSALGYLLAVTGEDVAPPSRAAAELDTSPRLARALRGDLDAILVKALERDAARRYQSVQDLQGDFERYLAELPVRARTPSPAYRLARFLKRRALAASLAALLALGALGGGVLYALQAHRLGQAREATARRGEFLERLLRSANPREGRRNITVAELLDSAAATLHQSLAAEPLVEASMLGLIVDTNTSLGRYEEGLAASDRQLALLKAHGAGNLELARALTSRGELLRTHARYADSVAVLREALALLHSLPQVDAEREAVLHELGGALGNVGAEREAESMLRQAIDLAPRLSAAQRGEATTVENDLAVLLGNEGRYAESAAVARAGLATALKYLPADHPYVLIAEQTYSMALLNLHRPADAEPMLRDVAARSARVNGPESRDTLIAQVQVGETLIDLGRFEEAQAILRPAAAALDRVEGADNRFATGAWSDFAVAACSGHEAESGLAAAQRILAIRARTLPSGDWHLLGAQADVGLCLVRLHRHAEAEALLLKAAADLEAARGPGFYTTQLTYKALRELYQNENRASDAARIASKIKD